MEHQKMEEVYVVNLEMQLEVLEEQYTDQLELSKTL